MRGSEWDEDVNIVSNSPTRIPEWRARHGFSVIMGGFHYYIDGEPQHPLSRWEVPELVRRGDLVPPTDEELRNWSQSDVLSKTIAIVQTLWFIIQTIARRIEGLPVTQLEIMTLAYTTITIAMYVSWWDKPQNVGGPFRVAVKELPRPGPVFEYSWYERISVTVAGAQDMFVDLRKARCVPTFYSGAFDDGNVNIADVVALFAAMVFGAVHCAAWHYAFPSYAERFIWRACSLAIVALPGAIMLVAILPMLMDWLPWSLEMSLLVCAISAPLYVAARSLLLALSFTTLRSLPPETYRAVQWTLRIPHFA
ncbi:hypothetical protein BV25DRAFT_1035204 [Artomyces pyxidatus]|uniref:Uncharacterized protein n=1 Tax=Artomyces pyxidatus TaxID=48021 RepID=A0ACB8STF0_9AGAM|nr:hypothetical protein BV25DRAFT_1035204 [Artomyces pyxidatus]